MKPMDTIPIYIVKDSTNEYAEVRFTQSPVDPYHVARQAERLIALIGDEYRIVQPLTLTQAQLDAFFARYNKAYVPIKAF